MKTTTRSSSQEKANATGDLARRVAGIVRRMIVGVTDVTFWQVLGAELLDSTTETKDAEVFQGVGIVARPPVGSNAETIVVFPGGASQPVIVGARDLETARAAVGELEPDETAIYTGKLVIKLKADETVTISKVGGTPLRLATIADIEALTNYVNQQFKGTNGHVHSVVGGLTTAISAATGIPGLAPTVPAPDPVGTTVLKAE